MIQRAMWVLLACVAMAMTSGCTGRSHKQADARPQPAMGPLRVHPTNPRYFMDASGNAVYLTGSHTWPNIVDMGPTNPPPKFDFDKYLDFLVSHGHNYTRLWTWESTTWNTRGNNEDRLHHAAPMPYLRVGPGNALDGGLKFDLTRPNPEYFWRLRNRAMAARQRGIYVSVMLFEGWGLQFAPGAWESHPFHPQNNINSVNVDANGDGKGLELHELGNAAVTVLQKIYVRNVIDSLNDLDNVLYEISNENHPQSTEWQYHMIRFIRDYEKTKPRQHPIGMTFQYKGGRNKTLFDSPADWISPNPEGGYKDDPPAADGSKVILNDTDHLWGIGGNVGWVWKSFTRGMNVLFMDPYDGQVLARGDVSKWDPVRKNMGYTLQFARRMGLANARPMNDLASSKYCLAKPAYQYLVYAPQGGTITLDLSAAKGALKVEWFDPGTGRSTPAGSIEGGAARELTPPFEGDAVLYVYR